MKKGLFALVCVIMFSFGVYQFTSVSAHTDSISAETVSVKTQNLYNSVIAQGTVVGNLRQSIIFSEPSNILNVYVTEGQRVAKGDKILLRRTENNEGLQAFAETVSNLVDSHIPLSFLPTVSQNTALITGTIDGTVTKLTAKQGEVSAPFTVIAEISDPNSCIVIAEIPELYISSVRVGQEAAVSGTAFAKETYHGHVTEISQKAQKKFNLTGEGSPYFSVQIKLTHADASLRQGCSTTVKIKTAEKKDALVIPYECIFQDDDGRELVSVMKSDGTCELRRIVTGLELEDETEILYGLKKGEAVVMHPKQQIKGESN